MNCLAKACIAALLVSNGATASEAQVAAGLRVHWDDLAEPMLVNGVWLTVRRATGRDVERLAARIIGLWPKSPGPLDLQLPGWTAFSQVTRSSSEVVQWRDAASGAELLWSTVDVRRSPLPKSGQPDLRLPSMCSWMNRIAGQVAGQFYVQMTAVCSARAVAVEDLLRAQLRRAGWQLVRIASPLTQLQRHSTSAQVLVLPDKGDDTQAHSTVVWTQTSSDPGRSP